VFWFLLWVLRDHRDCVRIISFKTLERYPKILERMFLRDDDDFWDWNETPPETGHRADMGRRRFLTVNESKLPPSLYCAAWWLPNNFIGVHLTFSGPISIVGACRSVLKKCKGQGWDISDRPWLYNKSTQKETNGARADTYQNFLAFCNAHRGLPV
jgi:hypothetical protein